MKIIYSNTLEKVAAIVQTMESVPQLKIEFDRLISEMGDKLSSLCPGEMITHEMVNLYSQASEIADKIQDVILIQQSIRDPEIKILLGKVILGERLEHLKYKGRPAAAEVINYLCIHSTEIDNTLKGIVESAEQTGE